MDKKNTIFQGTFLEYRETFMNEFGITVENGFVKFGTEKLAIEEFNEYLKINFYDKGYKLTLKKEQN